MAGFKDGVGIGCAGQVEDVGQVTAVFVGAGGGDNKGGVPKGGFDKTAGALTFGSVNLGRVYAAQAYFLIGPGVEATIDVEPEGVAIGDAAQGGVIGVEGVAAAFGGFEVVSVFGLNGAYGWGIGQVGEGAINAKAQVEATVLHFVGIKSAAQGGQVIARGVWGVGFGF